MIFRRFVVSDASVAQNTATNWHTKEYPGVCAPLCDWKLHMILANQRYPQLVQKSLVVNKTVRTAEARLRLSAHLLIEEGWLRRTLSVS